MLSLKRSIAVTDLRGRSVALRFIILIGILTQLAAVPIFIWVGARPFTQPRS